MNNIDRRALDALRAILTTDFTRQQGDYNYSYNGLIVFDNKPVTPSVNELKKLGYDKAWGQ